MSDQEFPVLKMDVGLDSEKAPVQGVQQGPGLEVVVVRVSAEQDRRGGFLGAGAEEQGQEERNHFNCVPRWAASA